MASSSSTSAPVWNHDVYLSFQGADTRKNFVDHLYEALGERGIITYLSNETLPVGEPIGKSLLKAIRESRISVVVFSKNYAFSSRLLDELEYIMRCIDDQRGQTILPIFYHVDRYEMRKQKGRFGDKFERYEAMYDIDKVELWRKALASACDIRGWDLNNNYRDCGEASCIKQIVETISNKLNPEEAPIAAGNYSQDLKFADGDLFHNHSEQINRTMSSSLLCSSELRNDVFLSFRGEDTGNNFVDHLYSALEQRKIITCKREETFLLGESVGSSHLMAIEGSQIAIIVFSQNYASSLKCLEELAYIMKCMNERGLIVVPLFYHVDPMDVRKQRGHYFEKALDHHKLVKENKVECWRRALEDAYNLSGWDILNIGSGYEAKGIKLIVDTISKRLFPDKDLIGLRTRLVEMKYGGSRMPILPSSFHEDVEHLKIPLKEILLATNSFSQNNIIAKGGFGKVYQGKTEKLGIVAVKQLDRRCGQGDSEFMMEIALLSTYKHDNLVNLVGFCDQDSEKILVYRYESNGSLDKHLYSKSLTWIERLQICLDAANGLKYLHDDVGTHHRVLHRDVKSSNILLDENWKAKISDFGLSKIALANVPCTVIISSPCGTRGYVDPQYQEHNILSQKSDVYSFGIVLLEVLFRRLVTDVPGYLDERHFSVQLAHNHYEKESLDEIIDCDLRNQMNSDSLSTFLTIAYQCLKKRREERPTMSLVVNQLEKALDYQQGSSGFWHDVYISFRERETECKIFHDLCDALHLEGISTYNDNKKHSCKELTLLKAIERSRCFVIIFTNKFAVNSWYLDEVVKITQCMKEKRQFVLPVFYNVSRSDVRTQKGYFGEVMSEYDTHPKLEVWTNALVEATNADGLEYSKFWLFPNCYSK